MNINYRNQQAIDHLSKEKTLLTMKGFVFNIN